MDDETFWKLIDGSRAECDPTSFDEARSQPAILQRKLEGLPPADIIEFDRTFHTLHARAYRWDLWGAAYVIEGGCSDDGFVDFRSGLIGLGRDVYEDALRDPATLARQPTRGVDFSQEELLYAARAAYEAVIGEEMPDSGGPGDAEQPAGERQWNEDTVDALYPELARRFARE